MLGGVVERERLVEPDRPAPRRVRRSTSTTISSVGSASIASQQPLADARRGTCTGTRPFFVQLLRKMSAKRGEITAWKP